MQGLPYSYSRKYRLARKNDVQSVFDAKPKKCSHSCLIVLYTNNQLTHARLGIIAGKKHLRRAVDRNRVRRIIRESFREAMQKLKGLDLVVMIRSACDTRDTKALRNDIDKLWPFIQ